MTPLQAVIVEILRARGFKVTEQDGYLVARSGTVRAAFCVMRKMERKDVDDFLGGQQNTGAGSGFAGRSRVIRGNLAAGAVIGDRPLARAVGTSGITMTW